MSKRKSKKVYRDGKIYVCARMCDTCIFRPGNLMHLEPGRVEAMVAKSTADESCIPCHETYDGERAVCHGFFKLHPTVPLRLAIHLGNIEFVEVSK